MTDEHMTQAEAEAESVASQLPPLLAALAEKLRAGAGAEAVFGEPVSEGGRTVIPVAQAAFGAGAGGGGAAESDDSGVGAGGGAFARPVGYIEVTPDRAAFVPLQRPWADAKLVLAYATIVLIVSRAIVKLVRG